jgi:hypothetical protein
MQMNYFDDEPIDGFSDTNSQGESVTEDVRDSRPNPPDALTELRQDPLSPDEAEKLREEAREEEEEEEAKAG